jgi:hypothetical protein
MRIQMEYSLEQNKGNLPKFFSNSTQYATNFNNIKTLLFQLISVFIAIKIIISLLGR